MTAAPASLGRLWALMMTVFVDMVGFLMVLPVAPLYAKDLGAPAILITMMISIYAVAQLVSSPLWGRLSDRHGRRPVLMIGITISMVSHTVFGLACTDWAADRVDRKALIALILLSRFVQGAGGAMTGVVQAYVADAIVPEERAKALGWISSATSAGVMLGPALGSIAVTVGDAGDAAVGFLAAALCVINLLFIRGWLPESFSSESRARANKMPQRGLLRRMAEVLRHPRRPVERLIWVYLVAMMAFMSMNSVLALFLNERFGMTSKTVGYVYTFVGTISLVMRAVLLGPAVQRFGERGVMRLGLAALTAGFALQPLASSLPAFAAVIVLIPIGTALLFPATTSLVTRYAPQHEVGATMGVQQAYGAVARLLGPIGAGVAFQYLGVGSPFWISAALAALTFVFALGLEPPPRPRTLEAPEVGTPVPAPVASRNR